MTPRSSHHIDSSRSERARSASGLMCTREPLPSGCLRQLSSNAARRIGADTCPAGRPMGDACARTPRVPSPSRRRRTFPMTCRAHQSECGWTAADRGHRKGGPASMDPHDATRPTRPDVPRATAPPTRTFGPQGPTLGDLSDAYLQDYQVRQFRSQSAPRAAGPPISSPSSAAPRGPPR